MRCGAGGREISRCGAESEVAVPGMSPEETRAATQQRLLGAFPRREPSRAVQNGPERRRPAAVSSPRVHKSVTPALYVRLVTTTSAPAALADRLLDGLDPSQHVAVTSRETPLAILAGPGSGKTRVLTHRIAWQVVSEIVKPQHVLAVTFTRRAAAELVDRLRTLRACEQVTAGTFHALALAQLRRWHADQRRDMPALLDRKARLLAPLCGRGLDAVVAAAELAGEIEWAKARLVSPDDYEAAVDATKRQTPRPPGEIARLFQHYEREKRRRGLVDFDDLILSCADVLEHDTEYAAVCRWRFRHFFVDEFQDANPAQFRLLRAWIGDRDDLCVVGDDDQAIYGFSGADADFLRSFSEHFPSAQTVHLEHSYRSTPQILGAARAVLGRQGQAKQLHARADAGLEPTVTEFDDDSAEAAAVARHLVDAHDNGRPWSSMAVLYRTNAQSARFEEALADAGVPTRVRGDRRFLERPEVRATLGRLRATSGGFRQCLDAIASDADASTERGGHTATVVRLGHEYLAAEGGTGSLEGFVAYLAISMRHDASEPDATADTVDLLTFHRAKGLEWHTVFVTGMEAGLVPIAHARAPSERAEEQRLFYVACTRAKRELHCSWARQRTFSAVPVRRTRSPYLDALDSPASPPSGSRRMTRAASNRLDGPQQIAALRESLSTHTGTNVDDIALLDALKAWRRGLARAASVPAFVIFSDRTLAEITARRPCSRDELLAVPGIGPVKAERYGTAVIDLVTPDAEVTG